LSSHASPSLEIEHSARSEYTVIVTVGATIAIVPWWLPQVAPLVSALIASAAGFIAAVSFWRVGWLGAGRRLHKAVWATDGDWRLVDRNGVSWPAQLLPASRILGQLMWLCFMTERGPRDQLLIGSDLAPAVRRRLITRLRLEGSQQKPRATPGTDGEGVAKDRPPRCGA
jgi:hypothetical protein